MYVMLLNNLLVFFMILFIGQAMADGAAPAASSSFMSFAPMLFFIGIIYFLLIKPQQKRAKQHKALIDSIKKGDKVVTNSGILGTVVKILNDQEILIEIADKVFVRFVKSTVSSVIGDASVSTSTTISCGCTESECSNPSETKEDQAGKEKSSVITEKNKAKPRK